jgi:spore coat polysaccharide biosynthesis predicted glycosyltransferase SpsG
MRHKYCIAIKTSTGASFGTGHMQRMSSLLWYLNETKNTKTFLVSDKIPDSFPFELKKYFKTNFDFSPDLIVRDMRDSSADEITKIRKIAPVLVIDDNGPGRKTADHVIDILPNPDINNYKFDSKIFIYGYSFLTAVRHLKNKTIKKNLDCAIYPGNSASKEYIDFLISLLPENSDYALLNGKDSYVFKHGKRDRIKESLYAELILSSKAVISHFGITLYEAFIANCGIIAINPTAYHSMLADMAKDYLHLANLGEYTNLIIAEAKIQIQKASQSPLCSLVKANDVYAKITNGLDEFAKLLFNLI